MSVYKCNKVELQDADEILKIKNFPKLQRFVKPGEKYLPIKKKLIIRGHLNLKWMGKYHNCNIHSKYIEKNNHCVTLPEELEKNLFFYFPIDDDSEYFKISHSRQNFSKDPFFEKDYDFILTRL